MAVLLVIAVLSDRIAVTMRNVALAAFAILAITPVALFSASFQLSFAATSILVWWYESVRWRGPQRYGPGRRIQRFLWGLVTTACLASLATAPFTAQHFGSVTPLGIIANIVAVPLTGLVIMPAGAVLAISLPAGLEAFTGHFMAMCPTLRVIWPHAGWDDTSSIMCLPIARVTAGINFSRVFRQLSG
jgi:competence protein ComEC